MSDPVTDALRLLEKAGVDHWEVFQESGESFKVEVKDGRVDSLHKSRLSGMAVRVISDGRLGFSFTSALDDASLAETVQTAVSMVEFMPRDPDTDLVEPRPMPSLEDKIFQVSLLNTPEQQKIDIAAAIEAAARSHDPRITTVRAGGYSDSVIVVRMVNSLGLDESGKAGSARGWVELMAQQNDDQESGFWMEQARSPQGIDPAAVATQAAQRALDALGGRPVPSARMPVVMENTVACDLLRILSGSFLGESHYKKRASPRIQTGSAVFSEKVSLIDDGLDARGLNAFPFDGEGTPSSKTRVIDKGVVTTLLFDRYHAKKFGALSTGNSYRPSFQSLPMSGITNLVMEPGNETPAGLTAAAGNGIMVTNMMGLHTANPISGDFSVGASGFVVEAGKLGHPVKGIAIAGNIMDLFAGVAEVAHDVRFFGNIGAPSFLVESLSVSGL